MARTEHERIREDPDLTIARSRNEPRAPEPLGRRATLRPPAEKAGVPPERLVLDLTALCRYPFANEHTLMPALGIEARNPAFVDEQKRHLGNLARALTGSRS